MLHKCGPKSANKTKVISNQNYPLKSYNGYSAPSTSNKRDKMHFIQYHTFGVIDKWSHIKISHISTKYHLSAADIHCALLSVFALKAQISQTLPPWIIL